MPVSFPLREGMTLPTALAAPVEAGIIFWFAPRPSRHSYKHTKNKKLHGMLKIKPDNLMAHLEFKHDFTTNITMNNQYVIILPLKYKHSHCKSLHKL
jgi:hypothetical protein